VGWVWGVGLGVGLGVGWLVIGDGVGEGGLIRWGIHMWDKMGGGGGIVGDEGRLGEIKGGEM